LNRTFFIKKKQPHFKKILIECGCSKDHLKKYYLLLAAVLLFAVVLLTVVFLAVVFLVVVLLAGFLAVFLTVFLFVAMVALVVYNFVFLISNFGKVFVGDDRQNPPRGFDIEGFERLNLIRK